VRWRRRRATARLCNGPIKTTHHIGTEWDLTVACAWRRRSSELIFQIAASAGFGERCAVRRRQSQWRGVMGAGAAAHSPRNCCAIVAQLLRNRCAIVAHLFR
jgi:hypothetical protein